MVKAVTEGRKAGSRSKILAHCVLNLCGLRRFERCLSPGVGSVPAPAVAPDVGSEETAVGNWMNDQLVAALGKLRRDLRDTFLVAHDDQSIGASFPSLAAYLATVQLATPGISRWSRT